MESVRIIPLKTTYTVKKGQELVYIFTDNPSIGKQTKYSLSSQTVVKHLSTTKEKQVAADQAQKTGGDAPTTTVLFEAIETGTCELRIQKYVKSALKSEHRLSITVE